MKPKNVRGTISIAVPLSVTVAFFVSLFLSRNWDTLAPWQKWGGALLVGAILILGIWWDKRTSWPRISQK